MTGTGRWGNGGAVVLGALAVLGLALGAARDGQEKKVKPPAEARKWTAEAHAGTSFPLEGAHRTVPCAECHVQGVFEGTPVACEACHWDRRQDDRYALRLGAHCGDCHSPSSWKDVPPSRWDHGAETGFRREGAHRGLDCAACHGEDLGNARPDCLSCHEEDYREAREPDHLAGGFPADCTDCHSSQTSWHGARFSHEAFTLKGSHRTAACATCHAGGRYHGTPSDCAACHIEDYDGTTEPAHRAAGFPTACDECHGDAAIGWEGAALDHGAFVLQGAHRSLDCAACHAKGYDLPKDCFGCHAADYNAASDPGHKASGFPTTCDDCHLPTHTMWSQAVFQHDFPIKSGRHSGFACGDCHLTSNVREFTCTDCHSHDKATADRRHDDVSGYVYDSAHCYACHPHGVAD